MIPIYKPNALPLNVSIKIQESYIPGGIAAGDRSIQEL
jgi:hypothetical protein